MSAVIAPPSLTTHGLAVGYPARRRRPPHVVLDGLDLTLSAGELVCLLGPNGSGKSTLLRTLASLQAPLAGEVRLDGDEARGLPARQRARRLAVVLTGSVDVGVLRVRDLVALGRHPHTGWDGRLGPEDRAAIDWALAAVGADDLAEREVSELSDGERQRALIARALAQQPRVLALDEPTAFVDAPRRLELGALLRGLARSTGIAVLLTTHDVDLALRCADRLWLIEPLSPAGRTLHVGAPEDLALTGAVARAFATAATRFDDEGARFVPDSAPLGRVRIVGTGREAAWAARAAERVGLAVDPVAQDLVVEVSDGRWTVRAGSEATTHDSLGEVAVRLSSLVATGLGHGETRGRSSQEDR